MMKLYLIGAIVFIAIGGITFLWFKAKSIGKQEQRLNNLKKEQQDVKTANKVRANNTNKSVNNIKQQLRNAIDNE